MFHADSLGTTRALPGAGGASAAALETDTFGNTVSQADSVLGARPFGFAANHGYQTDTDTGLMRLGHRYYDASTGRFISRDPIQDGYNWYNYCESDPVNYVDPEGLQLEKTKPEVKFPTPAQPPVQTSPAKPGLSRVLPAIGRVAGKLLGVVGVVAEIILNPSPAGDPRYDTLPKPENAKPSKKTEKERATDVPGWAKHYPKEGNESCKDWAERILNDKHGEGNWKTGPGSEYSKLVKWCERH